MNGIIKATPEDFKVKELATLPLAKEGAFSVYLLEKRGWNTIDALREISKASNVPSKFFSYGGKKDRHASTIQFIAIEGPRIKDFATDAMTLTFQGFMDRPMGPDLIEGNQFEIAVRQLDKKTAQAVLVNAQRIHDQGFPNYFDDQRFGSYDVQQGFLAEKILLGHLNGAVKIYMTSVYSGDPKAEQQRRLFFFENWKDWKACASRAHTEFEKFAFEELKKGEKAALAVLNQIPKEEMSLYFSAYQSFLWNQTASLVVQEIIGEKIERIQGAAGDYIFYQDIAGDVSRHLRTMIIPTAAHNTKMKDEISGRAYARILEERGVRTSMFNKLKVRRAFFKATDRPLIVFPSNFDANIGDDDLYPGKRKAVLKFILPRGSYATMLIKYLFHKGDS